MALLIRAINHVGISWYKCRSCCSSRLYFTASLGPHGFSQFPLLSFAPGKAEVTHSDLYQSLLCCRSCTVLTVPFLLDRPPSLCWGNLQDIPPHFLFSMCHGLTLPLC